MNIWAKKKNYYKVLVVPEAWNVFQTIFFLFCSSTIVRQDENWVRWEDRKYFCTFFYQTIWNIFVQFPSFLFFNRDLEQKIIVKQKWNWKQTVGWNQGCIDEEIIIEIYWLIE